MTSPINHKATAAYFEEKDYFGLGKANVFFFEQGMLPCVTEEGKIIMETAGKVSMAPDGNGGIYPSLLSSGALDDMEKSRGTKYLHVFSIDNALVKPADPGFLGFCLEQGADCGNKSTWKSHAHEKVGVVALRAGEPCVVEYSEITQEMAERTDDQGRLVFGAGNICNHFYTLDFLRNTVLPNMGNLYHIAKKKIPYFDGQTTVKPDSNNGIKLETFIFDVFPLSKNFCVWEVERSQEFAPVKNGPGSPSDSPDTARSMISNMCQTWLTAAGATIAKEGVCEISPLVSYGGEGLESYQGQTVELPCHLSS
uniref:UDP-N-acetylglucosamine diphosphorylase n=1 Tax=Entomoneis paludosa TaxID=265537 RepID=A0A7S2YGQ1_9STRA